MRFRMIPTMIGTFAILPIRACNSPRISHVSALIKANQASNGRFMGWVDVHMHTLVLACMRARVQCAPIPDSFTPGT